MYEISTVDGRLVGASFHMQHGCPPPASGRTWLEGTYRAVGSPDCQGRLTFSMACFSWTIRRSLLGCSWESGI